MLCAEIPSAIIGVPGDAVVPLRSGDHVRIAVPVQVSGKHYAGQFRLAALDDDRWPELGLG